MAFAQIYVCSEHGETINVFIHEAIDCENDEVYHIPMCSQCNREVTPLRNDEGKPVLRPLTADEMYWESFTGEF